MDNARDHVTNQESVFEIEVDTLTSTDAALASLAVTAATDVVPLTPGFAPDTDMYRAEVALSVTQVTLHAVARHKDAGVPVFLDEDDMVLTDADTSSADTFEVDLSEGDNVVKVKVTAEDGTTMKTYTVTVDRMASTDATLKTLSLSQGVLTPTFTSAHMTYTASVNDVSRITVTPMTNHAGATVEYLAGNDDALTDADPSSADTFEVDLSAGDNVVKVKVTAEDGNETETYTLTVTRIQAAEDATLESLEVTAATDVVPLTPAFTPDQVTYRAEVARSVTQVTLNAEPRHEAAGDPVFLDEDDMVLTDADTSSADTFEVDLSEGDNVVKVKVTAENGTTRKTYTLTVTRVQTAEDATLESLEVTAATDVVPLTPAFTSDQVTYRAEVARSVTQVTLNAEPRHVAASDPVFLDENDMILTDADPSSQNTFEVDLSEGANTIKVRVTAEDGITTKDYTLTVTRVPAAVPAAAAPLPPAALKSLEVTATDVVSLTPGFSPSTQTYTVTVPRTVSIVTLTATPDPGATVAYFDGSDAPLVDPDPGTTGWQVSLAAGEQVIQLRVSAPGRRERFYRVTVTPEVHPPGMPTGLRDQSGDGRVTLTWGVPPDDGGSAILRYEYRYAEGATVPEGTAWTGTGAALTATVTALANGQSYTFAVRAVNSVGSGEAARVTAMAGNNEVTAAWLSRFGRTVATHVTDAVGERLRAPATQESHVTFGGYRLPLGKTRCWRDRDHGRNAAGVCEPAGRPGHGIVGPGAWENRPRRWRHGDRPVGAGPAPGRIPDPPAARCPAARRVAGQFLPARAGRHG